MCIRDRLGEDRGPIGEDGLKAALHVEAVIGIADGGIKFGPVSYTHLRAHETVLDLVCRLLLEKKKQNLCIM